MAVTLAQLEQLYLAYFGRPADFDGVAFYTTSNSTLEQVETAFANSAESKALYGTTYGSNFVNAIYQNLFGRDADAAGLAYWVGQIANGAFSPAAAALVILEAAKNDDALVIANKLSAATTFTNSLTTATDILAYQGNAAAAAARTWLATVGATSTSLTTAVANLPSVIANIEVIGGATGTTVTLTTGIDTFTAPNATLVDTVTGIVDYSAAGKSTFSVLDTITGNGHTVVNVILKDATGGVGDYVKMSDVAQLTFTNVQAAPPATTFDGSQWKNVDNINLNGVDAAALTFKGISNANSNIRLKIDGAATGTLNLSKAKVGGVQLDGSLQNNAHNSVGAIAAFGAGGIDVVLGKSGYAGFTYEQAKNGGTAAAATVGDLSVGHVNLLANKTNADISYVYVYNDACATSHAATAGSMSLGNVVVNADATGAYAYMSAWNAAEAVTKGAATVGNIVAGDVTLTAGSAASADASFYNHASSDKGAATAGSVTLGNVTLEGTGCAYLQASNCAYASVKGAATVGNLTLGNVAVNATSATSSHYVYLYNYVDTNGGSATAGNIAMGDVDMNSGYYNYMYVENYAYAVATTAAAGVAKVGDTTVGNISMMATGTGTNCLTISQSATLASGKGTATAGSITLGAVTQNVATSYNCLFVSNSANNYGTGTATVGNITIGAVTMNQLYASVGGENVVSVENYVYASSGNATAGNVSIGDVNINAAGITAASGTNCLIVYNEAYAGVTGDATVGNITVGNVTAKTGISGYVEMCLYQSACANTGLSTTGKITVGNIDMQAQQSGQLYVTLQNYSEGANGGLAGGISVGNVTLKSDATLGTAELSVSNYSYCGDVGNVSLGNVDIEAQNVQLYVRNSASYGNAGTTTVGNVILKGAGTSNCISQTGYSGTAGTLTVGNISLTSGAGDDLSLCITNSASKTAGLTKVGDVTLSVVGKDAVSGNYVEFYITADGKASGDVQTGNITIGSSGISTKQAATSVMTALVSLSSVNGNVTVGNIIVTGGASDKNKAVVDDFGTLSNILTLTATNGKVTVGNVDYSGYAAASTIDVNAYTGAALISGSKGGSTITDNKATNAIVLNNTTKADTVKFVDVQTAVKDASGVVTAAQAALDTITGFAAGDSIALVDHVSFASALGGDNTIIQGTPSQTYAQFLVNAENNITSAGNTAYVAVIGGNTYVALANAAGKVGQIVEVMGSHTFSYDGVNDALVFLS